VGNDFIIIIIIILIAFFFLKGEGFDYEGGLFFLIMVAGLSSKNGAKSKIER
jgi:hypothetical protein